MRLGILNAIAPELGQVNWGGSPVEAYIRFFKNTGVDFDYAGYEAAQGQLPPSPDECDAYVITGSPKGVYDDDPWIPALAQFIRDAYVLDKKLVGICFGHQILAQALGGRAEKSSKGMGLGLKHFAVTGRKPWMNGASDQCSLYFAHQDQVTQLPPGAELLGGNDFCPNAFYSIGDKVFAIQGHPEFTTEIMEDLLKVEEKQGMIDEKQYVEATRSLTNGEPDNQEVARWIVDFLTA